MNAGEQDAYIARIEELHGELVQKQEFTMMVAHEMRNLLAPLSYEVQILAREERPTAARLRPAISRQLVQMRRLVDDLLDIACSEHGGVRLHMECVDLHEVIAAAAEVARPALAAKEHHLDLLPQPLLTAVVEGDGDRLTQVLSNIFINAAKFTPHGGRIEVSLGHEAAWLEVHVRDTGVGIAAEVLPRIFDPYVRGPKQPGTTPEGLGLGLAVARRLVEAHGGTLSATSAGLGHGSEFIIRLPREGITGCEPDGHATEIMDDCSHVSRCGSG
jgi:signal transduction histidine kinase